MLISFHGCSQGRLHFGYKGSVTTLFCEHTHLTLVFSFAQIQVRLKTSPKHYHHSILELGKQLKSPKCIIATLELTNSLHDMLLNVLLQFKLLKMTNFIACTQLNWPHMLHDTENLIKH